MDSSLKPDIAAKYYEEGGVAANTVISRALTQASKPSATDLAVAIYTALLTTPEESAAAWTVCNQCSSIHIRSSH